MSGICESILLFRFEFQLARWGTSFVDVRLCLSAAHGTTPIVTEAERAASLLFTSFIDDAAEEQEEEGEESASVETRLVQLSQRNSLDEATSPISVPEASGAETQSANLGAQLVHAATPVNLYPPPPHHHHHQPTPPPSATTTPAPSEMFLLDTTTEHLDIVLPSDTVVMRGVGQNVEPALLSGTVLLTLSEATNIREIVLNFTGKARLPHPENRQA